jgi:carbon-monoxide dehydrogenase small subunit
VQVTLQVNGEERELDAEPRQTLLEALRGDCGLTSAGPGCADGTCGACTVLVGADALRPCMMLAVQCGGVVVRTAEGLPHDHPLRPALSAHPDSCVPGLVMLAAGAMESDRDLTDDPDRVRELLASNACACANHESIQRTVAQAASRGAGRHDVRPGIVRAV